MSPTDARRLEVQLLGRPQEALDLEPFVPLFHRWIQRDVPGELWIDVADYRHVEQGPGVLLVAHRAVVGAAVEDGRPKLTYGAIRPAGGERAAVGFGEWLREALRRVARAAGRIAGEPGLGGSWTFDGGRWRVLLHDRLLAPPDAATRAAVEPELRSLVAELYPDRAVRVSALPDGSVGWEVRAEGAPGLEVLAGAPVATGSSSVSAGT